jgi:two-component system, NarL family, sensor kinase
MQEEVIYILIGSTIIILLLVAGIIIALFINQKRKFRYRQQLENQKKLFDEEILRTQLEIQTQTFETISRELHDNVSNTLSIALLNLNLAGDGLVAEKMNRIEETKSLLLEAKASVKDFSWSINPENIHTMGLSKSLVYLVGRLSKLKILTINFTVSGNEFDLESSRQIIIYRIAQEALNNCVKHGFGSIVNVDLDFSYPDFNLAIKDDGPGFDISQKLSSSSETHGSGLKNMISRAKMINADLRINSHSESGTIITLHYTVPFQKS